VGELDWKIKFKIISKSRFLTIGSSGGGELEDPDNGKATIKPLMTLSRIGIGDEDREVMGEQMGEGRTGEDLPSVRPTQ